MSRARARGDEPPVVLFVVVCRLSSSRQRTESLREENIHTFCDQLTETNVPVEDEDEFYESNLKHSINGQQRVCSCH